MDPQILLIIGMVILVAVEVVRRSRKQGVEKRPSRTHPYEEPDWTITPPASLRNDWGGHVGLQPGQVAQVNAEIEAKRKINAIKLYREFTGLGLKEAKEAVEDIMSGRMPNQAKGIRPHKPGGDDMMNQIQQELRAGRKINAIKLYREMMGVGLKEAKDAIDAMERGQAPQSICGDMMGQVEKELRAGRKINAVKLYREAHNVGLKEAKEAVDAMERQLGLR